MFSHTTRNGLDKWKGGEMLTSFIALAAPHQETGGYLECFQTGISRKKFNKNETYTRNSYSKHAYRRKFLEINSGSNDLK